MKQTFLNIFEEIAGKTIQKTFMEIHVTQSVMNKVSSNDILVT